MYIYAYVHVGVLAIGTMYMPTSVIVLYSVATSL